MTSECILVVRATSHLHICRRGRVPSAPREALHRPPTVRVRLCMPVHSATSHQTAHSAAGMSRKRMAAAFGTMSMRGGGVGGRVTCTCCFCRFYCMRRAPPPCPFQYACICPVMNHTAYHNVCVVLAYLAHGDIYVSSTKHEARSMAACSMQRELERERRAPAGAI